MLVIAVLLVAATSYSSSLSSRASTVAASQAAIFSEISAESANLLSALTDAETGQRGFIITGDELYLEPYYSGITEAPRILDRMTNTVRRRPDQEARLAALRPLIAEKLGELAETIEVRRQRGLAAAQEVVGTDRGKALMDRIRVGTQEINSIASERATRFNEEAQRSTLRLTQVSIGGGLSLLVMIAALGIAVLRSLALREHLYREAAFHSERLRVTLTSIGDGVIATDKKGLVTFLNPVAEALTGWPQTQALGRPVREVFHSVKVADNTVLMSRHGSQIPIDESEAPIRSLDDIVEGSIFVFHDISERHEAERKKLQAVNQQLREFVDGAAHDLRGSLRTISVWSELLEKRADDGLNSEARRFLGLLCSGVERMRLLLQDLLEYAQASHFERDDVDQASLQEAFEVACQNLAGDIATTGAQVSAGPLPALHMRRTHQVQLLQNLIGNAIKYRGDAAPVIRVSCERHEGEYVLSVSDNGMGIPAEYQDLIFHPFKRLHGEDLPGTGIGLAICTKIVSGYAGRIGVTSQVGVGSTFLAAIPVGC